jgi:hypothetical protein
MNRTVILSTNDNESYLSYYEYTTKAWNHFGWNTLTFYLGNKKLKEDEKNRVIKLDLIEHYRDETVVQVSRLFGHRYCTGLIMTSDMDMIPLSNYWNPDPEQITCYGHDLTHYQQTPICYIAMNEINWGRIIPEESIEELLKKYPGALSMDRMTWWTIDQTVITERLNKTSCIKINRGMTKGLARGRVDKVRWNDTFFNNDIKIDCHMPRIFNKEQTESVLRLIK